MYLSHFFEFFNENQCKMIRMMQACIKRRKRSKTTLVTVGFEPTPSRNGA